MKASVNNMDDAHEWIDTAIFGALKDIKPLSISINWNLPRPASLSFLFSLPEMMKIPKEVASCLDTLKHGLARLRLGKESLRRTKYDTSLDSCIFFKQGWKKFLTRHDMRLARLY